MEPWQPVSKLKLMVFSIGLGIFSVVLLKSETGWVFLLDDANLLFHEAGHFFFSFFGPTMELYGGTLGQFVFPIVVIIGFWRQRAAVSFAAGWIWFFENFFHVARYMADARVQNLPLVGGGEHDWFNIFSRWHVLPCDTTIAAIVQVCGWLGIMLVWGWLVGQALKQARPGSDLKTFAPPAGPLDSSG